MAHPPSAAPPAISHNDRSWTARPALAWTIRVTLFVVPLGAAWLAVHTGVRAVPRPTGATPTVAWVAGAIALSTLVHQAVHRVLRRFSSLGVLYRLSLTFPEAPPSRLGAALRTGRVHDIHRRMTGDDRTDLDPGVKAKRLADLVAVVSRREVLMRGHGDRVRAYAHQIGVEMGLPDEDLERLQWAALLHDVGMLDVPRDLTDRRATLDADARVRVERHPGHARTYIEPFADWLGPWRLAATEHHERWDGGGYPDGLRGEEISLAARIVAVADAYDAMTASRSYQRARSTAAAREELVDQAGRQFDPAVVRAFLQCRVRHTRPMLGPMGAVLELPSQLLAVAPGATAGAGVAATFGAVAVAVTVALPPAISSNVDIAPPIVERVVGEPTTTTATPTTSPPSSTRAPSTTTTPATTASTTTSTTTTTAPPVATAPPTTAPRTTAPPATTTTTPPATTAAPPTSTTTVPAYPVVTTTVPSYPTTGA